MNLLELVESGDAAGVVRELGELTLEQRAAHAAELATRRKDICDPRRNKHDWVKTAWSTAALGCQTTPAAAADWLVNTGDRARECGWLVDAVNLYPVAWRAELAGRLAERRPENITLQDSWFALAEHIVRDTGCPIPTTDTFLRMWLQDRGNGLYGRARRPDRVLGGSRGDNLYEQLRDDDFSPTLLPLAVARRISGTTGFRKACVELAAKGKVDRGALSRRALADELSDTPAEKTAVKALDGEPLTDDEHEQLSHARQDLVERLVARLLEDGTRDETEPTLTLLRALAPPPAENAALLRDHVAMLDLSTPVASYGHAVLIELDEAGLLEPDVLSETCERVLPRPEKKLVRAQLSWLDRVARRDPARAGTIVGDAAAVFQHPDIGLQERALKMIARHLRAAGDAVLPELRAAAEHLSPAMSGQAAEVLGPPEDGGADVTGDGGERFGEVLPERTEPGVVPGPIATAAEVAEEVAAVLADDWDVVPFERALDGLVRHARLDRAALSAALAPVMRREPGPTDECTLADLYDVGAAVRGDEPRAWHIRRQAAADSLPGKMLQARLAETIEVIESGTQPFLLAVPTLSTGALDAGVLVERIAELEGVGATPAPIDLAQALLRVDPAPDAQVRRAAGELRSHAGQRLAAWLRDGGLPHQCSAPKGWPEEDPVNAPAGWWPPTRRGLDAEPPLPAVAAALVGLGRADPIGDAVAAPYWVAQLPHHREEVAARLDTWSSRVLPFLAESGGPAGFAVHWHIARNMNDRAVDALLVLAAQGRLDARLLGGQLQALVRQDSTGSAKGETDALRTAAETGAYATVWSVLEAALPGMLRDRPVRGAGALLALAVECASRCGAKGRIPEVDEVAGRKASSQTVKNARLLRDTLR